MDNPVDICSVCGKVQEYGTMQEVNCRDFELLCSDCKNKRCSNCNFLNSYTKLGSKRYTCCHRGSIETPKRKICDHWEKKIKVKKT